jgi:hypothetical protein
LCSLETQNLQALTQRPGTTTERLWTFMVDPPGSSFMPGVVTVKGETVGADPRLSGWNASAEEDPARYRVLNSPKTSRQVQAEWMRRWVGNQREPRL